MTNQYTSFRFQIPSDSFTNVPGALLNFYEAGTLNRVTVYADEGLTTPLSNPVEADGFGLFPSIFLVEDNYDIVATDANDVQIWANEDYSVMDIPVLNSNYFSLIGGQYYPAIASNLQTGTGYNVANSDRSTLIVMNNNSGGTVTLPAPSGSNFPNKWYCYITNIGTGEFVVGSSVNINGSSTFTLPSQSGTLFVSTGSTYYAMAVTNYNQIFTKPGGTLTIASGVVTAGNFSQYLIDTEGGAASDDLDTINGGVSGKELVLMLANASHNVVLKHDSTPGAGSIYNPSGQDITLDTAQDNVLLRYDLALGYWIVQSIALVTTKLPIFTSSFTSSDQTFSFGTAVTVAHGLGVVPKIVITQLICQSADAGFATNDIVSIANSSTDADGGGTSRGFVTWIDSTNINCRFEQQGYLLANKTNGAAQTAITAANWKLRIIAYA